ncbi:DegT/DnrJ/EryC1/StrS family aminotransferase [Pseudanabaena sp. FACHB-2040]|uniref:DegT/DnrJ/EryC1/StrS family aminotransferase n=1 Tax=Pseudanabaena sp. FACHB-2040 TaxID=2692859 RepID=UPI001684F525|nr:DegT/DnrJ/EryC1/StrS family aminotransferase [Pseudanabaena sp. FACHB-2040]MBD2260649.1 DegT/DnrJ/EryC1/StrS family aminotransferase [Pseudanabaena sp. FACHB-2040]
MTSPFLEKVPFVDLSWQHEPLKADIAQAVEAVLQRGDFILGEAVAAFEAAFAAACEVEQAVGVGCGTDAIALGLTACGIGPGDEVLLPANTFVATLIGILRAGATPVLVDCHGDTALIDLTAAESAITPRTRAILPVHLYGQMVSPRGLLSLAQRHDLLIFEDAAQAHLAQREGYWAGSVGQAAAFSFYPSKNLGALGDGGMLVTQRASVAQTVKSLRNYGATRKYYHTDPTGTNSRLDTLQAAVLHLKLPHLGGWNQARNHLAQHYDNSLKPLAEYGILPLCNDSGAGHVYHLYVIRVMPNCPIDRTTLQMAVEAAGIQTGIHYPVPCHLQPAFENLGYGPGDFSQAEALSQEILSLPMYPGLTLAQIDRVVSVLRDQVMQASLSPKAV